MKWSQIKVNHWGNKKEKRQSQKTQQVAELAAQKQKLIEEVCSKVKKGTTVPATGKERTGVSPTD